AYSWSVDEKNMASNRPDEQFTFDSPGVHSVRLTVTDPSGLESVQEKQIKVGNTSPKVSILLNNNTFYWDTVQYSIAVKDNEDGILYKDIPADAVKVRLLYEAKTGGQKVDNGQLVDHGEVLLNESDCKGCHRLQDKSVGPDFSSIAARYSQLAESDDRIISSLSNKIITGGSGVWGKSQMSAHPQLNAGQTREIVKYILSLNEEQPQVKKIAISGKLYLKNKSAPGKEGFYIIEAAYADKGGDLISSLSDTSRQLLRYNKLYAEDFEKLSDTKVDNRLLSAIHGSYASIKSIDLSGVRGIDLRTLGSGCAFEIHIDSLNGQRISMFSLVADRKEMQIISSVLASDVKGKHELFLLYINKELRFQSALVEWVNFKQ
ncbi:MAG: c-type cytochrome, partial [Chitinophagaceae bacterium]|nr:c-type cytochrome [Chitinophagaceae bacterium]